MKRCRREAGRIGRMRGATLLKAGAAGSNETLHHAVAKLHGATTF